MSHSSLPVSLHTLIFSLFKVGLIFIPILTHPTSYIAKNLILLMFEYTPYYLVIYLPAVTEVNGSTVVNGLVQHLHNGNIQQLWLF